MGAERSWTNVGEGNVVIPCYLVTKRGRNFLDGLGVNLGEARQPGKLWGTGLKTDFDIFDYQRRKK